MAQADSRKTVLIVDDDEETRHVLRILCEADDELHVVGEAANGVEAVRLALNHRPSFIILDYRLPRLDGEGAAEILKAVTPGSKIVAFSALLDEQGQDHRADAPPSLLHSLSPAAGRPGVPPNNHRLGSPRAQGIVLRRGLGDRSAGGS